MSTDPEIARLRAAIDEVNDRLAAALHDRARLCRRIRDRKHELGLPAVDPAREVAMLRALLDQAPPDGLPAADLERVLAEVFVASRRLVAGE
jgi:chorismate mutase